MLKAPVYDLFITQEYDLTITEQAIRVIKDRILEEKMILIQVYLLVFVKDSGFSMGIQYRSNPINHVLQIIKNINGLAIAVSEEDYSKLEGSVIDYDGENFTIKVKRV